MAIAMTPNLQALDWCGSALGLLGEYTLAFRFRVSRYGWIAFFAANIIYIVMASSLGVPGLLAQQVGFLGSSAIGIFRHFVSRTGDRLESARMEGHAITMHLGAVSPETEATLPPEVAHLVQSARRLRAAASCASLPRDEPLACVAALREA